MAGLRTLKRILCATLLLALPSASMAESAGATRANPTIWRVHNGSSTLYVLGSLHVLPTGYAWRTPAIDAAMMESDLFVFEVPVDEAAMKDEKEFIVQNGILPPRQTLRSMLSATEFQTYSAVLRRAGLQPAHFERYRPWLAAIMLGLAYLHRDEFTTLKGADDDVISYAQEHGRKLLYLESIREQMELLTAGEESSQLKALKSLIVALPRSRTQAKDLLETWSRGDAEQFTALLESYFSGRPQAKEFLIDRRNRTWLESFKQFLARTGSTTMITVGAAHIGGDKGLIALLCGEGYEVERIGGPGGAPARVCGPGA